MPRYVILEHDYPALHWDFMVESDNVLRTWRLTSPPCPGETVAATASFDHRPVYLEYEGPVSGGRGRVIRWDAGSFTWEVNTAERVAVSLSGGRLRGRAVLTRLEGERWSLHFAESAPAA